MTVSKLVQYRGRVQGVGFRYTTQSIAAGYDVAGYVKNLPSGEVELLAEGEDVEVESFLAAVASQMGRYIQGQTVREEQPQGLKGFVIRV